MLKLFSEILGSKVFLSEEHALAGKVEEIIISPENGAFLGFATIDPIVNKIRYVPSVGIKQFARDGVLLFNYDSIADLNDLVRVKEVVSQRIKIIGSTVLTKDGRRVGKVNEAALDINTSSLDRIFVTPTYRIKYLAKDLIIPSTKIENILPKKIIISDDFLKQKAKSAVFTPMPAID